MKKPQTLRPGERLFALLLVVFAAYTFWESYGISGFDGLTTGGVLPMLASGVMFATGLVILSETLRRPNSARSSIFGLIAFLFPLRLVLFTGLVTLYVAIIPSVGFIGASLGLLFVAIWSLWDRGLVYALAISLLSTGAIYLLFRVAFQVVLPMGTLWQ